MTAIRQIAPSGLDQPTPTGSGVRLWIVQEPVGGGLHRRRAVEELLAVGYGLSSEFSVGLGEIWRQHPAECPPEDVSRQVAGEPVPAVKYIRATQERRLLQKRY